MGSFIEFFMMNQQNSRSRYYTPISTNSLSLIRVSNSGKGSDSPMSASSTTDTSAELDSSHGVKPRSEGYDEYFDPPLESKYKCSICLLGLREPVQTSCGHRFCRRCIVNSMRNCGPSECPVERCNESVTTSQIYPDKFAEQEMMTFRVFCQANEENECLWKGNLGELEDHRSECPFVMVGCTYDCGKQVKRKDLQQHTATKCLLRKISCDYCNEAVLWSELEQHFENCSKYPQQCNMCGKDGIERGKMEYHLEQLCLNVRIKCPLHTFGCPFEDLRSDVNKHIMEQLSSHFNNCLKCHQLQEDQEGRLKSA